MIIIRGPVVSLWVIQAPAAKLPVPEVPGAADVQAWACADQQP